MKREWCACFVLGLLPGVETARASFIPLDLLDAPDIASGFIDVSYDAGTDLLSAHGFALSFDDGQGPAQNILSGDFDLDAIINDFGVPVSGTLSIGGNVGGFGPLLLTGDLIGFGFADGGGELLEFLFTVTDGELAPAYGGAGALIGVVMDIGGSGYSGSFTQSFNNLIAGQVGTGLGVADTARLVPGPAVVLLLALGAAAGRGRRRAAEPAAVARRCL